MIPSSGRDVQCSNCGQTWFQEALGRDHEVSLPQEETQEESAESSKPDTNDAEPSSAFTEGEPVEEPSEASVSDHDPEPSEQGEPPQRRKPDESILGILREEAEREISARRAEEAASLETQTEFGLAEELKNAPESSPSATETHQLGDHMAKLRGESDVKSDPEVPRSELLPDIDEINSTLTAATASEEEAAAAAAQEASHRRGFRLGFALVGLIFAVLIIAYLYSASIAASVPAAEPALAAYVDSANSVRMWIDGVMRALVGDAG